MFGVMHDMGLSTITGIRLVCRTKEIRNKMVNSSHGHEQQKVGNPVVGRKELGGGGK